MTVESSLRALCGYPVPGGVIARAGAARGVDVLSEAEAGTFSSPAYRLAEADVCAWLSVAPDVSQDGVSYSLPAGDKAAFRSRALAAYGELGDEAASTALGGARFGYKGDRP